MLKFKIYRTLYRIKNIGKNIFHNLIISYQVGHEEAISEIINFWAAVFFLITVNFFIRTYSFFLLPRRKQLVSCLFLKFQRISRFFCGLYQN